MKNLREEKCGDEKYAKHAMTAEKFNDNSMEF